MKKIVLIFIIFIAELAASPYSIQDICACSKGDPSACNRIAILYESGNGVKKNFPKAKQYYKKSCELGSGEGCEHLAQILIREKDYHSASKYYLEGCNFNNSNACSDLAHLFEKGNGTKLNYSQAKKYHKKACDLGNQKSCEIYLYLDKNGIS